MRNTQSIAYFQKLEDDLNDAYENNDVDQLERFLSDDWTILESSTGISTKEQFLNSMRIGQLTHKRMKKRIVQIKTYRHFAIVTTKGRNEGSYSGRSFNAEQWVTNTYKKDGMEWNCIMTQESFVNC